VLLMYSTVPGQKYYPYSRYPYPVLDPVPGTGQYPGTRISGRAIAISRYRIAIVIKSLLTKKT
jgi:hypothetical protein